MDIVFLDSNVPMYVAGRDHTHKEAATAILTRIQKGKLRACTSTEVLQEILYRYYAIDLPRVAHEVYDVMVDLCEHVFSVDLSDTEVAKQLLQQLKHVGVRDAVHVAVMLNNNISSIASFDKAFDRFANIKRIWR